MKYLSVCSGIEAATVAWHHLGWTPTAFAEVEPFPAAVLKHHYPHVVNHGDMTKFTEWPNESIDILVGGTPCQSFSVAGLRQGLKDPRGNLMLTYLAIAERYRPKWLVWENVPGVLSSNGGRDFGTFLGALVDLGYGFAYRVLDAQWFGVAQRRRRVFVVGCLGDASRAAKVLFERESVSRNPAPSRNTGQEFATNFKTSVDVSPTITQCKGSRGGSSDEALMEITAVFKALKKNEQIVVGALCSDSHPGSYSGQDAYTGRLIATAFEPGIAAQEGNESRFTPEVTGTLRKDIGDNQTAVAFSFDSLSSNSMKSKNSASGCNQVEVSKALDTSRGLDPSCNQGGMAVAIGTDCYNGAITGDVAVPLTNRADGTGTGPTVMQSTAVRRLTPTECERLQGFPDGYTAIPWKKKPADQCPDGPRYKALGNSMAVPVMRWIGERIDMVEKGATL